MPRVLIGGFQHETNTFSPDMTTFKEFEQADNWPALSRHTALLERFQGSNIPISGFIEKANTLAFTLLPALWCAAPPAGKVDQLAYDTITDLLLEDITAASELDAIYLDLHGAMVTTALDDGEGHLLQRIRALVGEAIPIVVSLDFHANLTQAMVEAADRLLIYRTYPHIDMHAIGEEAATVLADCLKGCTYPYKQLVQADYLMPITAQCTLMQPSINLYKQLKILQATYHCQIHLAQGFPLSDIADAGPSAVVYAQTPEACQEGAKAVADLLQSVKSDYDATVYSEAEAIAYAAKHPSDKPIIFADTQDNAGAGGSSDTMGIFKTLVAASVKNAVVAIVCDPDAAQAAHHSKVGDTLTIALGEHSTNATGTPFQGTFVVKALSSGCFIGTGPFYLGCHINVGPMAYLEHDGVGVIVSTRRMQAADQAIFTSLGLSANQFDILVLKSSVHFRADFMSISDHILVVVSPGKNTADLHALPFQHCQRTRL